MRRRTRLLGALLALAPLVASACGVSGLAFVEDDRVEILTPGDRDEVTLPVTISWRSELPRRADGGPFWAVFVDREPVRPGQSLHAVADDSCNRTPGCPDVAYLRDQFVFLTDRTSVRLDVLPERGSDDRESSRDRHEAVVVPVDADGHRIGEASYSVEFRVEEGDRVTPDVVEELEADQDRLRERARELLGVSGRRDALPSLRESVASSGVGWYPLGALGLLVMVDQFQYYGFSVLAPEISRTLGISKGTIAFLVLLRYLAVMLASLPMAAAVQRRPRRGLLSLLAAGGWSVATLCSAYVTNAWGALLVLVADGASTGSVQSLHVPLVVDSYPPDARVRALAAYQGAAISGTVLAPLLVAALAGALHLTWRGVFLTMGGICVVATICALRLRDPGFGRFDTERVRAEVRGGAAAVDEVDPATQLGFFETVRRLMLVPTVRRMLTLFAVFGTVLFPLYTFLFFFLDERWDLGPGARGVFFAAVNTTAIPVLAWFGPRGESFFRADPERYVRRVAASLVIIAVGLVVAVASPVFPLVFVGFVLIYSVAYTFVPATNVVLFSIVAPRMRAHLAALVGIFTAGVGGVGGLLLLNGIDRRFGTGGAIASLTVPIVVGSLILRGASRGIVADLDRMIDEILAEEQLAQLRRAGRHLPMLACRHVDFSYGQLQVLFDVDFTVDDGEMVALLGTNGAGKSTLLRVVSGLGLPSRGSVHFAGHDVTFLDAERRLGLGITQIPGGKATFGPLTVVENLRVFGHSVATDRPVLDAGIDATFEAFPRLAERRNQAASTLSGGERQMLALGKAFILRPRLLLIDELSLGLAPKVVGELLEMVRRINGTGTAVVLVEQSVNVALSLVDHAYFMEKGEVRFDGAAADLLDRRDLLRSVFLEGATKGLG